MSNYAIPFNFYILYRIDRRARSSGRALGSNQPKTLHSQKEIKQLPEMHRHRLDRRSVDNRSQGYKIMDTEPQKVLPTHSEHSFNSYQEPSIQAQSVDNKQNESKQYIDQPSSRSRNQKSFHSVHDEGEYLLT